jgi:hypothetical protein
VVYQSQQILWKKYWVKSAHADSAPPFLLSIFKSTLIGYPQARGIVLVIPLLEQAPCGCFLKFWNNIYILVEEQQIW